MRTTLAVIQRISRATVILCSLDNKGLFGLLHNASTSFYQRDCWHRCEGKVNERHWHHAAIKQAWAQKTAAKIEEHIRERTFFHLGGISLWNWRIPGKEAELRDCGAELAQRSVCVFVSHLIFESANTCITSLTLVSSTPIYAYHYLNLT